MAPELSAATARLVTDHAIEWRPRTVEGADLTDAWLVHTATGDGHVDAFVAGLCEERRIICVNAGAGRLEIRLPRDFSTIDRLRLEAAVRALLDQLD